jgi:GNAT superfamily N-acetyltransferase
MGMVIRRATPEDLDQLVGLRVRFIAGVRCIDYDDWNRATRGETRAFLEGALADGRYVSWVADSGEGLVGCAGVSMLPIPPRAPGGPRHDGLVLTVWVEPGWRSSGVGRQLMEALVAARDELSIDRLFLHATDMARPLYESLGFHPDETLLQLDHGDGRASAP